MGMSMVKQVVNDKAAYMVQQGQKQDITGNDLKEAQQDAVPFDELTLSTNKDIKLAGIEAINGADAYAIKLGEKTYYYDVATGYKVAVAQEVGEGDKKATQTTYFGDYKAVKGVKLPYKVTLNMGMDLEFKVVDAKINEGVTPADFQ